MGAALRGAVGKSEWGGPRAAVSKLAFGGGWLVGALWGGGIGLGRGRGAGGSEPLGSREIPDCGLAGSRYVADVDWQQVAALAIVAATAVGMGWRLFGRRSRPGSRSGFCGCADASASGRRGRILCQARKGERPRITVRLG